MLFLTWKRNVLLPGARGTSWVFFFQFIVNFVTPYLQLRHICMETKLICFINNATSFK